jgi:hypothetical protein
MGNSWGGVSNVGQVRQKVNSQRAVVKAQRSREKQVSNEVEEQWLR